MEEVLENSNQINFNNKKRKKKKNTIILVTIGIFLVIGVVLGVMKYQQNQTEKKNAEYAIILAETTVDMYFEFIISNYLVISYSDIWENAIDLDIDFNDAVNSYKDAVSEKGVFEEREKEKDGLRNNMKLLQNPPTEYMESYIVLKQMYGIYSKMYEQSLSPTGSLVDFNRKTNDLTSQYEQLQEELLITLPADVKELKDRYEKEKNEEVKDDL
ncbi:hypothetical protein [Psychrobacillus psychrodurans]|uniref:hypothetical protein n=1 Tax=Psychrobacillus psychrodurans TaxID=126157 RepID=UPI003CFD12F7